MCDAVTGHSPEAAAVPPLSKHRVRGGLKAALGKQRCTGQGGAHQVPEPRPPQFPAGMDVPAPRARRLRPRRELVPLCSGLRGGSAPTAPPSPQTGPHSSGLPRSTSAPAAARGGPGSRAGQRRIPPSLLSPSLPHSPADSPTRDRALWPLLTGRAGPRSLPLLFPLPFPLLISLPFPIPLPMPIPFPLPMPFRVARAGAGAAGRRKEGQRRHGGQAQS